jgi:hypothetical protein
MTDAGAAVAIRNIGLKAWRRLRSAHKPFVRLARRRARAGEHREVLREVAALERELERIATSRAPIIVGPWLAEVGYEVLYWVPFLRWFQDAFRLPPDRLVVVSRGGVADWYAPFAARYVELFDFLGPADLTALNDARREQSEGGGRKQTSVSAQDDALLRRIRRERHLADGPVLHPSMLFRLFRPVWHGALPYDYFWDRTRYVGRHDVPPPSDALPPDLPAEFSTVKFYSGTALPVADWTRERLRDMVAREAAIRPVIVLDTGVAVDEHEDYAFADIPNVTSAARWMTPATNLGRQSALIARSHTFLSTCGGLAWLAPFLGTPTIAAYVDDRLLAPHLYVARQALRRVDGAPFLPLDLRAEHQVGRPGGSAAVW